jgi:hypothetical protein
VIGRTADIGAGVDVRIAVITVVGLVPSNAFLPVVIS